MIKIGITGGIGSGKSTASRLFELLGIPVYYSDTVAKELMDNDSTVKNKIIDVFGADTILKNNLIDRKIIAGIVFNDKDKLQQLNAIIHPAVAKHFDNWLLKQTNAPYILKETAILFESGAYKLVDKIIVVTTPKELRIDRIMLRDRVNRQEVEQRMKNQMNGEELLKLADFIIVNDETQSMIKQVLTIHKNIIE